MKALFTLAICSFVLLSTASAQIKRGEKMLGGSIAVMVNDTEVEYPSIPDLEGTTSTSLAFYPQLGFGLGNNWIVGLRPGFIYNKQKQKGGFGNVRSEGYTIAPGIFVRKYSSIGERFGIFGQADVSYAFGKNKFRQGTEDWRVYKLTGIGASVQPGAFFRASKRFAIEAIIGGISYNRNTTKPKENATGGTTTSENFNLSLTNNLSLGFQLVL